MKTLTRVRLVNWHLFENTTITCQGTTYFIGVNGAGKSTILDAVQFALVGGQRDVRFNQAAMVGSHRTLNSYIRGELGTEAQRYLRGDCSGLVALEFLNPDGTCFAHGALVDAYADNHAPDVIYFLVHNASLNDAWFFKTPDQLFDTGDFRRHMEHFALPAGARAQVFTRLEDYRAHLLNRLGQLRETFPAKIVKGIAFSPLTNIRDFVHNYLLDENLVDVKTLQQQLETLRHFEGLVADIRRRIADLEQIEEFDQERLSRRRLRIINGFVRRQAEADLVIADLERRRLERDEVHSSLQRAQLLRDGLSENVKLAQDALVRAQVALRTDQTAARQANLRNAITAAADQLATLRQDAVAVRAALVDAAAAMQSLSQLLAAEETAVPAPLAAFLQKVRSVSDGRSEDLNDLLASLPELQLALASLGQGYADNRALLSEQVRVLREEGQRLERQIAQLHAGDRDAGYEAEAPAAARLRRLLRAELGLQNDQVFYLCQVLKVPNEAWQDAAEGVLGGTRFHLLVPFEHYDAAIRLYRDRRFKENLHGVGLPDGERMLAAVRAGEIRPGRPGTLAAEVEVDPSVSLPIQRAARAYLDLLLGHYMKCDTLEQLRNHRTAVTRECFVRRNYTTSHLDPAVYRRWFIGERAIPRQIEERQARLRTIGEDLAALAGQLGELDRRLGLSRDQARGMMKLEHDLPLLVRVPEAEAALFALQAELEGLDTRAVSALESEVQRTALAAEEAQNQLSESERSIGGLTERLESLDNEVIPGLARSGANAAEAARTFLNLENAEDTLDDCGKEYARRRERQALEILLANATHYEGDYSNAENRSRDRLRESKQAYSLRYDFGYDDDEDASRYLAERARYVESELPDYEERVAHQRRLAEQELVENFIHRLREQIEDARSQLEYLNATLNRLRFGGERYEFLASPAPDLRQVYDMIMDSQAVLGAALFDSDFRRKHQEGWDLLFEHLTIAEDDELAPELRRLQDYRNYLVYDIRIHYPNGDRALHSQISAKKSGGETTTPFYVAMAASFAQAYRLNQARPSDTIRLALFDEAFGKMDTARTASALKFMVDSGLQVLLATPPDKAGGLLPHVDSVRTVVRHNSHSFVLEIDKRQVVAQLEPEE